MRTASQFRTGPRSLQRDAVAYGFNYSARASTRKLCRDCTCIPCAQYPLTLRARSRSSPCCFPRREEIATARPLSKGSAQHTLTESTPQLHRTVCISTLARIRALIFKVWFLVFAILLTMFRFQASLYTRFVNTAVLFSMAAFSTEPPHETAPLT